MTTNPTSIATVFRRQSSRSPGEIVLRSLAGVLTAVVGPVAELDDGVARLAVVPAAAVEAVAVAEVARVVPAVPADDTNLALSTQPFHSRPRTPRPLFYWPIRCAMVMT